ncbi:MAG: hypothetical protein M1838_002503, partial [Thelocarpon superellum]
IVKENTNPKWNETKYIILTSFKDSLTLQVFDFNEYRRDKELGTATFSLEHLEEEAEHENQRLEIMGNGKARGQIQSDIRFFPVLEGRKLGDGHMEPPPESKTGIARFTVEQAKDLDGTKSLVGQLNPYAVLLLNGKEVHTTHKIKRSNNPIWDNGAKDILITDRSSARLGLVIKDERELGADVIVGTMQTKLDDMMTSMEKGQEWYNLAGAKTGRTKLTLQWKPVALPGSFGGTGGYVTPIGVMRFHFQNARNVRNVETVGKSDPYVRILLSGIEKGRTVTFQANLNPDWDEILYVPMHSTRERLTLEVMDEENLGKDRSLGLVEVAAADYIKQAENGEYLASGEPQLHSDPLRMFGKGTPKGTLTYTAAFYPCMDVVDPEEEAKEAEEAQAREEAEKQQKEVTESEGKPDAVMAQNVEKAEAGKVDEQLGKALAENETEQAPSAGPEKSPKLRIGTEDLARYGIAAHLPPNAARGDDDANVTDDAESGLIVFKLIEADLAQANCHLEVLIDDMRFPSYISSKAKSRKATFDETGDTFVREMDVSQITLQLRDTVDRKGDEKQVRTLARLSGDTLGTLKQCLDKPTVLTLHDSEGGTSTIKVSLRYIPVKMQLDPRESINNSGEVRVDVLDATDLPSADRNGYSDPYCRFLLNEKEVFKTKVQKKTLSPVWGEFFVVPVPSRIAANFKVIVMDWDLANEDDLLGASEINLDLLEPLVAQEYKLKLDGTSGTIRLRLHFKPNYVKRSHQGSSTFSGTFATPGRIVTGVAGAPIKGVGFVGGGMVKGASFIKHGFRGKKRGEGSVSSFDTEAANGEAADAGTEPALTVNGESPPPPSTPQGTPPQARSRSFGTRSIAGVSLGKGSGPEAGTASITIVSASGFPAGANVRVQVKQLAGKGGKEVHKSKALKAPAGSAQWEGETFKVSCAADTQFQLQVKDHSTFGSDDDLGEGLFVIDDSSAGSEKTAKVGQGSVVLRSSFTPANANGDVRDSPKSTAGSRRSFLAKKEP